MADPLNLPLFQQKFLTGHKPLLRLDDEFLKNYTKVLLRSDVSNTIWEVKLDGDRLADGWEEFAAVHKFQDGDVLVFRHDGDESFHVSVSSLDTDVTYVDDDEEEEEDYDDESEDDEVNILVKKNKKREAESSSSDHCCYLKARVTPYSLNKDRLDLCRDFKFVSFNKQNKLCEIDLVNETGRKWRLILSRNRSSGSFYIRQGWVNFCYGNKLSEGDLCKFKLYENGERPVLWLCSKESGNGHEEECPEAVSVRGCNKEKKTPSPFLKIKLTPNRFKTGQLYISSVFTADHGIEKSREMILLNEDGRKWESYLHMTGQCGSEWFYLRNGWKEMCKANGVNVNDSFVLELIREDENHMFKFCSKIESNGKVLNQRTRKKRVCETPLQGRTVGKTRKVETVRQRVSHRAENQEVKKRGRPRVSNKPTTTNSRKLRCKQSKCCSVSDQVANVKRCVLDTLNTVRQFRVELETKEKNLEASLVEIDALGEMILGISQIFNNKVV